MPFDYLVLNLFSPDNPVFIIADNKLALQLCGNCVRSTINLVPENWSRMYLLRNQTPERSFPGMDNVVNGP